MKEGFGIHALSPATLRSLLPCWWRVGLKITQQASEGFLVVVMLLPTGEVSDVARPLEVGRPTGRALQHSSIKANGKQHRSVPGLLLRKSRLDLKFHPHAFDGILREHQQELVIEADGLVDALPDFVTGLHVFRSEPAAHPLALQIGIQPLGKALIFARIANKAGVVLDRVLGQGAGIDNEGVTQADLAQKFLGNVPLRAQEGVGTNGRRACMPDRFQSFDRSQIHISKDGPSNRGSVKLGTVKGGTAKVGTAENGIAEISIAEGSTVEIGKTEVSIAEVGTVEVSIAEVGAFEFGTMEVGTAEVSALEVSTAKVGKAEVSAVEVSKDEVRQYLWILLSPCIPDVTSLFENIEFLVGHAVFPPLIIPPHYNCSWESSASISSCFSWTAIRLWSAPAGDDLCVASRSYEILSFLQKFSACL
jgi:hypothetical protein